MKHKKAAEVLISMVEKYSFGIEENEALSTAIGVLAWTCLSESRMKEKYGKAKRKNLVDTV